MPTSFPTLSSGSTAKYPLTRKHIRRTTVLISEDSSEQRWAEGTLLETFQLVFKNITTADKETIRSFWNARQGSFNTSWQITLQNHYNRSVDATAAVGETVTWKNMQFVPGKTFEATQIKFNRWSVTLDVRQTLNSMGTGDAS